MQISSNSLDCACRTPFLRNFSASFISFANAGGAAALCLAQAAGSPDSTVNR